MSSPAGFLHDLGAVVATHLAEGFVAVHNRVVDDLRVGQQEAAVCCAKFVLIIHIMNVTLYIE